ncbi:uncharacterized protein LOC110974500 isoform X2 [Acanthaster planci]|uniref:Uncharacterized protein LOC110974500 isoform X2 n=1 Tax=Acanthaster planci TaxID=133434 RepID=A0A8B7XM42_ACAPL|nr:uncharacterized protein LOC110974500 isoform X2 [Acanthaster planci]
MLASCHDIVQSAWDWLVKVVIELLKLLVITPLFHLCVAVEGLEKNNQRSHVPHPMMDTPSQSNMAGGQQSQPKTTRVLLWAPPRSLSTAFERCISSLGDRVQVCHELYTAACHLGPENQIKIPVLESVVRDPHYTYAWVQKIMEARAKPKKEIFFCKELAYSVEGKFDKLPAGYRHTFLIRHPARVFLSMNTLVKRYFARTFLNLKLSQVLPKGLVYEEMYNLFQHVTNELGQEPIIIDADDLMHNPLGVLYAYCDAVGIPFSPSMDKWRPIKEEKRTWIYSTRLMIINKIIGQYDRAFRTAGLEQHVEKPIDLRRVTPEVLEATKASIGYYEKMYTLRLKPMAHSTITMPTSASPQQPLHNGTPTISNGTPPQCNQQMR